MSVSLAYPVLINENKRTSLFDLHLELGAKLVPYAGYLMPVQYPSGIIAEHSHTRNKAGLFDCSHMGQVFLKGCCHQAVVDALERLIPTSISSMAPGSMKYTLLLNNDGGIVDDLMVTRLGGQEDEVCLMLVVNASRKDVDYRFIREGLPTDVVLELDRARSLLALQGPQSEAVMAQFCPEAAELDFMTARSFEFEGIPCHISRSGYTGEDGFEISVGNKNVEQVARKLLNHEDVAPCGLGARDTLRLEAGFCLYGHDIDDSTSPIEAGLSWIISKNRRVFGDFPGSDRILHELESGPDRRRVGIRPDARAPVREGAEILDIYENVIGIVTSGGFGPSVDGPIAMGYVDSNFSIPGTEIYTCLRGRTIRAEVCQLPFIAHRYKGRSNP